MSFNYTRANYKTRINAGIQGKIGMLISDEDTMNEAARQVIADIHLRSARRKADLSPNLFKDIYQFSAPSDLFMDRVITILPQPSAQTTVPFNNVPTEEFEIQKNSLDGTISIDDFNGTRVLNIARKIDDKSIVFSSLDSLTAGGGTWVAFGDGTNLRADQDNFIKENGSVRWDIDSAGGTTAGIENTGLNSIDLDDNYLQGNGAAFVWAYLNDATNVTNFILRLGSSSSNYYSKTITTQHDGTAFVDGWNLLRFDLTSLTETGTVDDDTVNYAAVYMTKDASKVSETDYRFDWLVLKRGMIHEVRYYTKYPWNTSAGAYLENSTNDSDVLVADTNEFNLFILKGREIAAEEVREYEIAAYNRNKYKEEMNKYQQENPSQVKIITNEYHRY